MRAGFRRIAAGLVVYADATGARMQTTGTTDVAILKEFFRSGAYGDVKFRIPTSNPAVRDRVMLMNAKLESADGERHADGASAVQGVDQGFRASDLQGETAR